MSHSRHSYPLDRPLPVGEIRGQPRGHRQAVKRMHRAKQRQHDRVVIREQERETPGGGWEDRTGGLKAGVHGGEPVGLRPVYHEEVEDHGAA